MNTLAIKAFTCTSILMLAACGADLANIGNPSSVSDVPQLKGYR